jgi:hypothetical protein
MPRPYSQTSRFQSDSSSHNLHVFNQLTSTPLFHPAGWTPLHWSVQTNSLPLTSYLLNHRSDPTLRSFKGLQPLDVAQKERDGDTIRELLLISAAAREEEIEEEDEGEEESGENGPGEGEGETESRSVSSRNSVRSWGGGSRNSWTVGAGRSVNGGKRDRSSSLSIVGLREMEDKLERDAFRRAEAAEEAARWLGVDLENFGIKQGGTNPWRPGGQSKDKMKSGGLGSMKEMERKWENLTLGWDEDPNWEEVGVFRLKKVLNG